MQTYLSAFCLIIIKTIHIEVNWCHKTFSLVGLPDWECWGDSYRLLASYVKVSSIAVVDRFCLKYILIYNLIRFNCILSSGILKYPSPTWQPLGSSGSAMVCVTYSFSVLKMQSTGKTRGKPLNLPRAKVQDWVLRTTRAKNTWM